jgi:ribosomal protein S18 acetylase RimI-like enzyme
MSSRRVQVRRAASDDVDAVVRLHEPLHRMHVEALPAEYVPFDAVGTRTYYAQVLLDAHRSLWLAEVDGVAAGFAGTELIDAPATPFTTARRLLYVHQIAVAVDLRRAGVGRALMAAVEQAAADHACDELRLQHRGFNDEAHRFYESFGYRTEVVTMARPVLCVGLLRVAGNAYPVNVLRPR